MCFFGTYAIIALTEKNPNYEIFKDVKIITCVMNVGEIYNIFLREKGKNAADEWFGNISFELLEITPEIMVKSVYFRHLNKKKKYFFYRCRWIYSIYKT